MFDNYDNITFISLGMGESDGDYFVIISVKQDKSITFELVFLDSDEIFIFN